MSKQHLLHRQERYRFSFFYCNRLFYISCGFLSMCNIRCLSLQKKKKKKKKKKKIFFFFFFCFFFFMYSCSYFFSFSFSLSFSVSLYHVRVPSLLLLGVDAVLPHVLTFTYTVEKDAQERVYSEWGGVPTCYISLVT
jgi:hypothetical protein